MPAASSSQRGRQVINPSSQPERVMAPSSPSPGRAGRNGCLAGSLLLAFGLLASLVIVVAAAYGGWNAGLQSGRAKATESAESELREQCDLLLRDLGAGKHELAQTRIDWLQRRLPEPACLRDLASVATAAYVHSQPSPTSPPTRAAPSATPRPSPTVAPIQPQPTATLDAGDDLAYDLEALLAEANAELGLRNYTAAIRTLEAIVSIDEQYQRERTRAMLLEALTAQALALYRSFDLSEAVVLTERAEQYGDIGELNYERYVADTFLIAQRNKTTNPAEATRRFSEVVQRNPNYMNGQVIGEWQDALRYYGDALLLAGDACSALQQYGAALALHPNRSLVSRGLLNAKQQEAAQSCGGADANGGGSAGNTGVAPVSTRLPIGVRGG